ncbi:MAG TPA: signal peptidase I [Kofleriaceae bacterium]|jgi:signal peptidase I
MRSASLDRRVKREAKLLVREAHKTLDEKKGLRGRGAELEKTAGDLSDALRKGDLKRARRVLPALDALVDERARQSGKSTARDYIESIGAAILIALALRAVVLEAFKIPSSSMYPTLEIGDHIFVNKFIYGLHIPWTETKLFTNIRKPHRGEVIVFEQPCTPWRDYIKRVVATEGQTVEVRCGKLYVDHQPVPQTLVTPALKYEDLTEATDNGGEGHWIWKDVSEYEEVVGDETYHVYEDIGRPMRDAQLQSSDGFDAMDDRDFPSLNSPQVPKCGLSGGEEIVPANQLPGKLNQTRSKSKALPCEQQLEYVVPPGHVFCMGDNRENSNDSRVWGSVPIENIKGKALFIWLSYREPSLLDWQIRWTRMGNFVD